VTDPDTLVKRLEKAGIGYSRSHIAELGLGQLFFQDPAGNGLEANFRTQD
jgi:extradiol dioxygenase family protein